MARNSGKLAETPNVVRRSLRIRGFGDLDGEIECWKVNQQFDASRTYDWE